MTRDVKRSTFQLRVSDDRQRQRWQATAEAQAESESSWARDGLDAWVMVCTRARELGSNPRELLDAALEDHVRARAAVSEIAGSKSLSETEKDRLLRILAPTEWARRDATR